MRYPLGCCWKDAEMYAYKHANMHTHTHTHTIHRTTPCQEKNYKQASMLSNQTAVAFVPLAWSSLCMHGAVKESAPTVYRVFQEHCDCPVQHKRACVYACVCVCVCARMCARVYMFVYVCVPVSTNKITSQSPQIPGLQKKLYTDHNGERIKGLYFSE